MVEENGHFLTEGIFCWPFTILNRKQKEALMAQTLRGLPRAGIAPFPPRHLPSGALWDGPEWNGAAAQPQRNPVDTLCVCPRISIFLEI